MKILFSCCWGLDGIIGHIAAEFVKLHDRFDHLLLIFEHFLEFKPDIEKFRADILLAPN